MDDTAEHERLGKIIYEAHQQAYLTMVPGELTSSHTPATWEAISDLAKTMWRRVADAVINAPMPGNATEG